MILPKQPLFYSQNNMPSLCGLHDIESIVMAPPDTWIVDTVALSDYPQPMAYPTNQHVIARLNWAYGSGGTLPLPSVYEAFAELVAQYVNGCSGCSRWQIGNEPNLSREWPDNTPIYPWHYAACYKLCRQAIHALPGHEQDEVLVAGSGPWNAELKYSDNPNGDWITYFSDVIELLNGELDGFAIHAYTHAYDTALVSSTARMASPFESRYYEFRTYRDYCNAVPEHLCHLPVYLSEVNGNGPWQAVGLMPAMLAEIDDWNLYGGLPLIQCVIFYRYPHYDDFYIEGRADVIAEYQAAVAKGYASPMPVPPWPEPTPTPPQPPRDIDPDLYERGVTFNFAEPPAGTGYWRITYATWLEDAANQVGPDHHILGQILRDGQETAGVPLFVEWPSDDTIITSKADDPNASYNYDYGMSASLNEYSIYVADGNPSDGAAGIGMGKDGNPKEHTSTWITFEWTIYAGITVPPIPPTQTDIETGYVTARAGLNVRSGPSAEFDVLGTLAYGSTVLWDGSVHDWMHVVDGWVSGEYVEAAAGRGPRAAGAETSGSQPAANSPQPLAHPLPGSVITNHFYQHPEAYQVYGLPGHSGTDLAGVPQGTPIGSIADGVVYRVDVDAGYGNFVMVAHDQLGAYSLYAHCSEILMAPGTIVAAGEAVALVGSTGNSTGPHLHLEIREMNPDGSYRDGSPMKKGRVDAETWCFMHGLTL